MKAETVQTEGAQTGGQNPDKSPTPLSPVISLYTANEIATVLGRSRQGVYQTLKLFPATGLKTVRGQKLQADAWSVAALPPRIRAELEALATKKFCRSVDDLFSSGTEPWAPPVPFSEVPQGYRDRAEKLRQALADLLPLQHKLSAAELQERGLLEYRRVFGHAIGARTWRRLFDRTVERDRGYENWQRVELYLDDAAFHRSDPAPEVVQQKHLHHPLDEVVAHLENPKEPTTGDKEWLLNEAFHHFEALVDGKAHQERRLIKTSLLEYLLSTVPALSRNAMSMRRLFDDNYHRWTQGGRCIEALEDQRRLNSGNFRTPEFKADLEKIRNEAIKVGGNESLAHRRLRKRGELSPEFVQYYDSFDERRNKSRVPAKVRETITPEVDMCGPLHRGTWEAKMRGPYIKRNWDDTEVGNYFSGDDVTWNNYYWFLNEFGKPVAARGECLVFTELKTSCPLSWALIPGKYNSQHIRLGILKAHDEFGLPDLGFYFENGVWRARLIEGDKRTGATWLHWRETTRGLLAQERGGRQIFVHDTGPERRVRHATSPRSKPIERAFLSLQQEMRSDPGFCGFNERIEKMERLQEFLALVKSGKVHPREMLLHRDDWNKRIQERMEAFMHEPQNGEILRGRSPWEAMQERMQRKPFEKLPDNARWILATHQQRVTVYQDGIHLTIRGKPRLYCGEETGHWVNREVIAYYNVERPELLTLSDLDRKQYFTAFCPELPAMTATSDQFAKANRAVSGHMQPAKELYSSVNFPMRANVSRDTDFTEPSKKFGEFHEAAHAEHAQEEVSEDAMMEEISRLSQRLNRPVPPLARNKPDVVLRGLRDEIELLDSEGEVDHE